MSRTPSAIAKRSTQIRRATPNGHTLENLFEMQNHICDLCGHPIQALLLAALDHCTPVIWFAKSSLSLSDAIQQANDRQNLRAAHASCNHKKSSLTREEWFAQNLDKQTQPRSLTSTELQNMKYKLGATGRKMRKLGKGIFAPGVAAKGGYTQGYKHKEQKTGVCGLSPDRRQEIGNKTKLTKSGIFSLSAEQWRENRSKGGKKALASGQLDQARHIRWHVLRGIPNPECLLCR